LGTWGTTLSEPVIKMLQQAGFTDASSIKDTPNRGGQFLLKSLSTEKKSDSLGNRQLLEPANWDLRMIYSDGE